MDESIVDVNFIQKQFLCCTPMNKFQWKPPGNRNIQDMTTQDQKIILDETVNHHRVERFPIKLSYVRAFLKSLINEVHMMYIMIQPALVESAGSNEKITWCADTLEQQCAEVHDDVYAKYCELVARSDDQESTHYRHFVIDCNSVRDVVVMQESTSIVSLGTTGLCTWQAGLALGEWCAANENSLSGKKILELGAGVGLTGLTVVKTCSPREYTFTDYHPAVLAMLRKNLQINLCPSDLDFRRKWDAASDDFSKSEFDEDPIVVRNDCGKCQTTVRAVRLLWEEIDEFDEDSRPDVVLAADVLYDETNFQSLINALRHLLKQDKTYCLMAATVRNLDTIRTFLDLLESHRFIYEEEVLAQAGLFVRCDDVPVRLMRIEQRTNHS